MSASRPSVWRKGAPLDELLAARDEWLAVIHRFPYLKSQNDLAEILVAQLDERIARRRGRKVVDLSARRRNTKSGLGR